LVTYVPNRFKIAFTTDNYIERLLETLKEGLNRYKNNVILYDDILQGNRTYPENANDIEAIYDKIVLKPLQNILSDISNEYEYISKQTSFMNPKIYLLAFTIQYFIGSWEFKDISMKPIETEDIKETFDELDFTNIETDNKNIYTALVSLKNYICENDKRFYGEENLDIWRFI
jgi:hypothetical protein